MDSSAQGGSSLGWLRQAGTAAALTAAVVLVGMPALPAHADEVRDRSWHLKALRIAEAHKISQGEGVKVAVIDSGVDPNHPDLRGNVLPGVEAYGDGKGHRDLIGHGTAVASIIAGHGHGPGNADGVLGIAPKAKIIPINVDPPKSPLMEPQMVGDAIKLAVHMGARVICVAIAGSEHPAQREAIDLASSRGVPVIAGSGNKPDLLFVGSPASIPWTVGVTATGRDGKLHPISTTGRGADISAPGADIQEALPGGRYGVGTGTSTATAVVAGAVALIRAKYPNETGVKSLERLVWTTNDGGKPGPDLEYGWGTLDVMKALTTPNPAEPFQSARPDGGADSTTASQPDGSIAVPDRGLPVWPFAVLAVGLFALLGFVVALVLRHRRRPASLPATGYLPGAGGPPGAAGPPGAFSLPGAGGSPGAATSQGSGDDEWRRPTAPPPGPPSTSVSPPGPPSRPASASPPPSSGPPPA